MATKKQKHVPAVPSAELTKTKDKLKLMKERNAELTEHALELTGAEEDADLTAMRKATTRGRVSGEVAKTVGAAAG